MPNESRRSGPAVDGDGVRATTSEGGIRRIVYLLLAMVALVVATGLLFIPAAERAVPSDGRATTVAPGTGDPCRDPRARGATSRGHPHPRPRPPSRRSHARSRDGCPTKRCSPRCNGPRRAARSRSASPATRAGSRPFRRPGTKPIKRGIVVPEDFALPPGYVRHYQTADDGSPLAAVLMFHPDFELVDADGRVVPLPEDRLVPPELAPEGLAIDLLDVPEPAIEVVEPPGGGRVRSPAP